MHAPSACWDASQCDTNYLASVRLLFLIFSLDPILAPTTVNAICHSLDQNLASLFGTSHNFGVIGTLLAVVNLLRIASLVLVHLFVMHDAIC